MTGMPMPDDEHQRLQAVYELQLLDTAPEERFDRITRLARRVLDAPVAAISLMDAQRQWFKSIDGLDTSEVPRDSAFCAAVIAQNGPLVVEDALANPRFSTLPIVVDEPRIRFYCGVPLRGTAGHRIGAFSIKGFTPRSVGDDELRVLSDLARIAESELKASAVDAALAHSKQLSTELSQRAAELAKLNQDLREQIDERERVEGALEGYVEQLDAVNRELDAFTYSVSHDLKEPLRTIEAFAGFLLADYGDCMDDQGCDYLERLQGASFRMKQLIEDLLLLSRIGHEENVSEVVDVGKVIGDVREGVLALSASKHADFEVAPDLPHLLAHGGHVEQLFSNLISNALKFNDSDRPHIHVGSRGVDRGMVTLFVQDNGIGVPPEYQEEIFGIFRRLHRREDYDGTGAGLSIVKRIVECYGGRVWVESQPGEGTTFYITLPIADAAQAEAAA